ncbi:ABC transporter substrate-binding protein [Kutzneria viridogrisea]|uniref:Extracellular solute-binding protein family 5 n=2 Tax=Kutzneria TaxID=43356 RepID=W5W6P8_9PSEU|nr:ABC transporter substrate-binding protein [Kutzneria albida]AHH96868.1 extracellular solute-binding protein family 5 [Kutzneria albida DSM 43870]MBA8927909.1 peptide/nickel transport system substrate-binding protein [Kutzneria viridogrisea]
MTWTRSALLLTAGVLLGTTAACGGGTRTAGGAFDPNTCQGGTLRILNQKDAGSHLDPARLYTSGGGNIPSLLFRTLTTRNRAGGAEGAKVVPDLATDTGQANADATVWTYHLRDGLKFEDGTPITSQDVKYGIERSFAAELPGGAPYLHDWLVEAEDYQGPYKQPAGIPAIETPDARTIVFHLNSPHGDFPYLATATQFAPVPKAKDTGADYEKHPISSGPYKIDSYQKGKSLTLVRNENWSRQVDGNRLACPDRIEGSYGLDAAVINQRISTGSGEDANAVTTDTDLGPSELAQLDSNPELAKRVAKGGFPYTYYLAFDTTKAPFDNQKVREAFTYAVDRQSVVNAAGGSSLAYPATTFLPNNKSMGYQAFDYFPAGQNGDPAKAKQLLAEAGFPNGITVTLAHRSDNSNGDGPAIATAVQDAYKKAGITVNLQSVDAESYPQTVGNPATQPQVSIQGWGADWPSGGPFLVPIFDGRQYIASGGNFNTAHLNDPAVNAEIDQINKITDPAQAAQRWGALDAELGKKAVDVPLYHSTSLRLFGKNVRNAFVSDWTGVYDLSAVSVK